MDKVDWEGLKAELKRAEDGRMITIGPYTLAAILAAHERDQRVIAAAEKLFCESIVATQFMDKHRNYRMTCDVQELLAYINERKSK